MHLHARFLFVVVWLIALATAVHGELVFDKTEIELHPAVGDEKAIAKFPYQNKGDKPVAIKSVTTSCGCTAASAKQTADPGEKGEVTATFTIGDRIGTQQKGITVVTDDVAKPTTSLMLKVVIPQVLELQPAFLVWQPGEAAKAKTIVAKAGKDVAIKNVEAFSSSPDFTTKVEPGSSPGEFRIELEPKQTAQAANTTLTIRPMLANGKPKAFYASARVMPQLPAPGQVPSPPLSTNVMPLPQPVTSNSAGPNGAKTDACSFITSQEVQLVQGEAIQDSKSSARVAAGLSVSECYIALPTSSNSISLTVTRKSEGPDARNPKAIWTESFHGDKKEQKEREEENKAIAPEKVDGIGDEAFWLGNRVGGDLYVLKGNSFIRLSVGGGGDKAAKMEKSKKLAQAVLKHL